MPEQRATTMTEQRAQSTGKSGAAVTGPDSTGRSAILRCASFFLLWLVLIQSVQVGDVVFGACVALAATWVSLRLSPPATGTLRFASLMMLLPHFLWQSVRAGVDVARRALSPNMNLQPGLVTCPLGLAPGTARNTFATITSMLPGTVPCDVEGGELVYHCLDTSQPVVEQLWEEERRLASALVAGASHG
jgi:multicomponent Na+:H+ antiporter subunit E